MHVSIVDFYALLWGYLEHLLSFRDNAFIDFPKGLYGK